MIRLNIEHAPDVAPIKGQALAKNPAPGAFHHRRLYGGVSKHHASAAGPAGIALPDPFAPDIDAAGVGEADIHAL
ncbi:hypothetical protein D3C73_1517750 [compost metagenome]